MTAAELRPRFDPVVNWGHVLVFAGLLLSAVGLYIAVQRSIDNHELRIGALEAQLNAQIALNTEINSRLGAIREDLAVLKAVAGR